MRVTHGFGAGLMVLGGFTLVCLNGCGSGSKDPDGGMMMCGSPMDGGMMMPQTATPSSQSAALWGTLSADGGYHTWPTFSENASLKCSQMHMGMYVIAYHNNIVTQAVQNNTLPLPVGSVIAKDNFANATDAMPMSVTVMSKTDAGWYWLEATPEGKVVLNGMGDAGMMPLEGTDVMMCMSCHSGAASNDNVFTHHF